MLFVEINDHGSAAVWKIRRPHCRPGRFYHLHLRARADVVKRVDIANFRHDAAGLNLPPELSGTIESTVAANVWPERSFMTTSKAPCTNSSGVLCVETSLFRCRMVGFISLGMLTMQCLTLSLRAAGWRQSLARNVRETSTVRQQANTKHKQEDWMLLGDSWCSLLHQFHFTRPPGLVDPGLKRNAKTVYLTAFTVGRTR